MSRASQRRDALTGDVRGPAFRRMAALPLTAARHWKPFVHLTRPSVRTYLGVAVFGLSFGYILTMLGVHQSTFKLLAKTSCPVLREHVYTKTFFPTAQLVRNSVEPFFSHKVHLGAVR